MATPKAGRPRKANGQLELQTQDGPLLSTVGATARVSVKRASIQDALLAEGLLAVKLSARTESLEKLNELLISTLHQNGLETRRRYAQSIAQWFFSDGINGLLSKVWRVYRDEDVMRDLLRWSYLAHEPVMGSCVADALFPLENGIAIPPSYFDKFLIGYLGGPPPAKTRERLKINLKRLGFLERARGKPDRLAAVAPQEISFLILLHHIFAPRSVRTVELRTLFANPFWRYLGYKSEDAVRNVLREADAAGVIGKYIVADHIEQVTTRCVLPEWLEKETCFEEHR
jgi:hypothetical protein